MLARLDRGHSRLEMQLVWSAVVEDLHGGILDDCMPVGDALGKAKAARGGGHLPGIATADGDKGGVRRRRCIDVVEGLEGVAVCLAHEGITEHADDKRRD